MLVSEIFSNHVKELVSNFWKIFSAFTRRMARLNKLKIPAEIYVTLISSQWDLVLAFVNFIHKSSPGFMILETSHLKE